MKPHAFSLASKLAAMAVGDVIYLPDTDNLMGPTLMERNVQTAAARSRKIAGRRFTTARCDVVVHRRHELAIRVERLE